MSNDIPNFNLLAVFAAVMEQGSLSKAASQLNTNQSTISTALARLKKELGQELFIRKGRGVVPTAYSKNMYEKVKMPVNELNDFFQSMATFDEHHSERKFVVSSPEHLQWLLLQRFAQLPNQNLSLEVFDQPDSDDNVYDDLLIQKFDAMIDIVVPEHPSIVSQKLYDGEFVIVCRKEHPRIQGELTETQFMSEKHAVLDRTRRQVRSLNHFTGIDLSKRKIVFHGRSLFSNILLSSQSDYLTVVPRSMAMQFQQQLDLQIFSPPFEYVTMSHYLIWLRKLDNDPAHRWLRNQIGEWAAIMSKALKESSMIFDRDA